MSLHTIDSHTQLSKIEKGKVIVSLVSEVTFNRTTQEIANIIKCSVFLLNEIIEREAENISHNSLDKIIKSLEDYY